MVFACWNEFSIFDIRDMFEGEGVTTSTMAKCSIFTFARTIDAAAIIEQQSVIPATTDLNNTSIIKLGPNLN